MALLQIQVDDNLQKALKKKALLYQVPVSSLVRIVLVKSFLEDEEKLPLEPGNVFNAYRDNHGKGIKLDDLISAL